MSLPGFACTRPPHDSPGDRLFPQLTWFCEMECGAICDFECEH
ncbi:hypothetical protein [Streptomyces jumonjinensis]